MKIVIEVYSKEQNKWVETSVLTTLVKFKGNNIIKLVKLGILSRAIGRHRNCIIGWEKEGNFPKPRFYIDSKNDPKNQIRWYSISQVLMVQKYMRIYFPSPKLGNNNAEKLSKFFHDVQRNWRLDDQREV